MDIGAFQQSLKDEEPSANLAPPLQALWWDAKGDWSRAHALVDELETPPAMAVHAYLHRKQGERSNAEYWYRRAERNYYRENLSEEWNVLARALLAGSE